MKVTANSPESYIAQLPEERKAAVINLRKAILENLPEGFEETMSYGMIGYVVPHSVYPKGYHSNPKMPLPFMNIASQKNYIAVHHIGIYGSRELSEWYVKEYNRLFKTNPDMGKGCLRFRKVEQVHCRLIGELASKMSVEEWISIYEKNLRR